MPFDHAAMLRAHLKAEPGRVWHALTDAEALTAWYWPESVQPKVVSDARPGGRFAMTTNTDGMAFEGEYQEFDPPRRLVQAWRWAGETRNSRVTIDLTPSGTGTDLRVVHDQLDEQSAQMYQQGWQSCLDRLPAYLA